MGRVIAAPTEMQANELSQDMVTSALSTGRGRS